MHAVRSVRIDAPAAQVFGYLTEVGRHPEWAGNPLTICLTSSAPLRVGSTWESTGRRLGTHLDRVTVVELDPERRFAYEADGDAGRWRSTFTLRADGDATVLHREMRSLRLTWFTRALAPMILLTNGFELARNLRKIKACVEKRP
ncbi:SRPBCC family protein [Catellatospora sichuanensis]|uniref:SRPBCC family protein n=1 Tax=Catellatospora sichuanensis TaxID=1969805 RepID=UPI001642FE0D|nr:SRPBCC family protein [Catellatospora sichuanensis]